jgi:hypothetical protein
MKKILLVGAALLALIPTVVFAAAQVFTPSGIADVVAAYVTPAAVEYETVAASQTAQALGATGATGDLLEQCIIIVATAATAATTILDNSTAIVSFANSPGGGIGTYVIPVKARSVSGAWKITTGAGASVVCTGDFT